MTTPRKTPQNLISVYTNAAGHTCVALFIKGVKEPVWWRTYRPSDAENVSRTGELLAKLTLALPALAKKVQYPVIFQVRSPIIARILWDGHQPDPAPHVAGYRPSPPARRRSSDQSQPESQGPSQRATRSRRVRQHHA